MFTSSQIAATTSTAPPVRVANQPREQWDPNFDDAAERMFGRVWEEVDFHPLAAKRLREVLGGAILGNLPKVTDLGLLISVVQRTRSEKLRDRAYSYLAYHLREGTTDDRKTEIADLLGATPTPTYWTPFPVLMDKIRKAIDQYQTPKPKEDR
jgi:hypothetical protein